MIKNPHIVKAFERKLLEEENLTDEQKVAIYDSMYLTARQMGRHTMDEIWDGFEDTLHLVSIFRRYAERERLANR